MRRITMTLTLSVCLVTAASAHQASAYLVVATRDFVVNNTPACGTCGGRSAIASSVANLGSYEGLYSSNACGRETIEWIKGAVNPWSVETLYPATSPYDPGGWYHQMSEMAFDGQGNVLSGSRDFFNAETRTFGNPRIPTFFIHNDYDHPSAQLYCPLDREAPVFVCPQQGQHNWYLLSGPNGYPEVDEEVQWDFPSTGGNAFRVKDCRPGGDCTTQYTVNILIHTEPQNVFGDREYYYFGQWLDPQTGQYEGLGLLWFRTSNDPFAPPVRLVVDGRNMVSPCTRCPD